MPSPQSLRGQIVVAESGIRVAGDSYRRNLERIRGGQGLPLEVLQSIQALDQSRREYLRAVGDYDEWQFRLYRPGLPDPGRGEPREIGHLFLARQCISRYNRGPESLSHGHRNRAKLINQKEAFSLANYA